MGNTWGAYAQLLPQLELTQVYNAFNFNLSPDIDLANTTGSAIFIASFLCPSDPSPPGYAQVNYGMHNYLLNVGNQYPVLPNPIAPLVGQPNGMFYENSAVRIAAVTDGLSNSVAISESIRSVPGNSFAMDPLGGFVITGNNKTNGPPISSDADYQSLCVAPARLARVPGDPGQQVALWSTRAQPVQPSQGAERSPGRLPRRSPP